LHGEIREEVGCLERPSYTLSSYTVRFMTGYIPFLKQYLSLGRAKETSYQIKEGCLPGAVGPDYANYLTLFDGHVQSINCNHPTEALGQPLDLKHGSAFP